MENDVRLTLRLPKELHEALARLAAEDSRSLNGEIVYLLRQTVPPPAKGKRPTEGG